VQQIPSGQTEYYLMGRAHGKLGGYHEA